MPKGNMSSPLSHLTLSFDLVKLFLQVTSRLMMLNICARLYEIPSASDSHGADKLFEIIFL
jgi:hypothetical protein